MSALAITITIPSVPEGWQGGPDALLEHIAENATFAANGALLTGQIGGSRPASNVGLWVNGTELEIWDGENYVPILTVPIGAMVDWCGNASTPPDNYLLADGEAYDIEDYPELYAVIGHAYTHEDDESIDYDTQFRVPDGRGRVCVGAGTGDYNPTNSPTTNDGVMIARAVGQYFGNEWLTYQVVTPTGSQVPRFNPQMKGTAGEGYVQNTSNFTGVWAPSVGVRKIIRYR